MKRALGGYLQAIGPPPTSFDSPRPLRLAILTSELFRKDLGGYGGYGRTATRIAQHYNSGLNGPMGVSLWLAYDHGGRLRFPAVESLEEGTLLPWPRLQHHLGKRTKLRQHLRDIAPDVILTIDYLPPYEFPLIAYDQTPLLIYFRDPRTEADWRAMAAVPQMLRAHHRKSPDALAEIAAQERESFHRVLTQSKKVGRPVAIAANGEFLIPRGVENLGVNPTDVRQLQNPIELPKPSSRAANGPLLFVGRMHPQKRPWIIHALARRMPDVEFVLAGPDSQLSQNGCAPLPNVRRVGVVDGPEKDRLFRESSALLNTSIHEGLPVTFLESFSYARPVISCLNPDGLVERFGYLARFRPGDGLDEGSLASFETQIRACLTNPAAASDKGLRARRHIATNHSYPGFGRQLDAILGELGVNARVSTGNERDL